MWKICGFCSVGEKSSENSKEELAEIKVWMTIKENEVIYRSGEANHE